MNQQLTEVKREIGGKAHKSSSPTFTADELRRLLCYDPGTGLFKRLVSLGKSRRDGLVGTSSPSGHWRINVRGRKYLAHRLAWYYVHGEWPAGDVDHINGQPADNRIANLRVVSAAENCQNQRGPNARSTTRLMGVSYDRERRKWRAGIWADGRTKYLGLHPTAEAAHAAYLAAKRSLHPGCTI
jgi:hypothetical protein